MSSLIKLLLCNLHSALLLYQQDKAAHISRYNCSMFCVYLINKIFRMIHNLMYIIKIFQICILSSNHYKLLYQM